MKLLPGSYTANITITAPTITVDGFGATVTAPAAAEPFLIKGVSRARFFGVAVVNESTDAATGGGIHCENTTVVPSLELDQVSIDAAFTPLAAVSCNVTMNRSTLHGRPGSNSTFLAAGTTTVDRSVIDGGLGLLAVGTGSVVHVTNTVFTNLPNGAFLGGKLPFGTTFGSIFVSFSTVVNGTVACGTGRPVCSGGTDPGACIDNSIIMNAGGGLADTVSGTACETNYSIVFPQSTALNGTNNKLVNPLLADQATGDFHLQATSPAVDAANPTLIGTPDFDGLVRPQGAHSDIGAFEFKP